VKEPHREQGLRFDADHGVVTEALLFLGELDAESIGEAMAHATHYEGVPIDDCIAMLDTIPGGVAARSTFVDVGSGLGRAVFLAMLRPFKRIVGIEVSGALHETALENLATLRAIDARCGNVRLLRADARTFEYPPGDLVVFLYNPFDAEALDATLARIAARPSPGETHILYHTPLENAAEITARYGFTL
jgi:SAM-dependent methyltransferase